MQSLQDSPDGVNSFEVTDVRMASSIAGIPPGKSDASGGIWPKNLMFKKINTFYCPEMIYAQTCSCNTSFKGLSEYFQHIPNSKVSLIYGNHGNR